MKKKQSSVLKCFLLALCLSAAGCFYSCGVRENDAETAMIQNSRAFQAEISPEEQKEESSMEDAEKTEDADPRDSQKQPDDVAESEPQLCCVYVCGAVQSPGVYMLSEGARIYEAVDLAGGFADDAAESWLNLAEPVRDGMKLEVPTKSQVKDTSWLSGNQSAGPGTGGDGAASGASGQQKILVNINTASQEELMTLKGIGASRAEDIIRYRQEAGGFHRTEDIMKVPGIKDAAFQKIKDNITV